MRTLLDHLNTNCKEAWSGRVWLDIEGTQYWTGDTYANRLWYQVGGIFVAFTCSLLWVVYFTR